MKILAALTALVQLFARILSALQTREREQEQAKHEQTVQDIQQDPVGYARREYGSVRQSDAGPPARALPRDQADRP